MNISCIINFSKFWKPDASFMFSTGTLPILNFCNHSLKLKFTFIFLFQDIIHLEKICLVLPTQYLLQYISPRCISIYIRHLLCEKRARKHLPCFQGANASFLSVFVKNNNRRKVLIVPAASRSKALCCNNELARRMYLTNMIAAASITLCLFNLFTFA